MSQPLGSLRQQYYPRDAESAEIIAANIRREYPYSRDVHGTMPSPLEQSMFGNSHVTPLHQLLRSRTAIVKLVGLPLDDTQPNDTHMQLAVRGMDVPWFAITVEKRDVQQGFGQLSMSEMIERTLDQWRHMLGIQKTARLSTHRF